MINVLICDDQAIVTEGLRVILSTDSQINVLKTVHDGAEAIEAVDKLGPDLVLMDLKMPILNGVQATRRIKEAHPEIYILILTTYDADEWLFDAIRSGADGYLLKDTPRHQLIEAIKETVEGKTPVDPAVAGKLFAQVGQSKAPLNSAIAESLTERERDVLALLAKGLTNTEIAERLFLSEGTVRNYVSAIFSKLEVTDRTQAAVIALRYGLAELD